MNKVTLLAIIALTMVGSLVFRAWQQAPVAVINPQPKMVVVASSSVGNEEFRAKLRKIVAKAKASGQKKQAPTEKNEAPDSETKPKPDKTSANL